jgi:hypothetical protein
MTTKEHLALHDKQIKAIRELLHEGMRLMVETRRDLKKLNAGVNRIESALELHITGKRTNGNGKAGK